MRIYRYLVTLDYLSSSIIGTHIKSIDKKFAKKYRISGKSA